MYKSYNDTGVISHVSEIIILFFYQVKLSVQKEIQEGAVLQQDFIVEFLVTGQMCDDCHRVEAKDYWQAVVQVSNSNSNNSNSNKNNIDCNSCSYKKMEGAINSLYLF